MIDTVEDTEEPPLPAGPRPQLTARSRGNRKSFGNIRRELTEDELQNPGTQKMLLDELDRLESELIEAKDFQDKFHDADKNVAVYEQRLKTHIAFEIFSTGVTVIGSLIAGSTFTSLSGTEPQWAYFVVSILLIVVGVISKAVKT